MKPDYAPENESRRAEVIGRRVQFFYRNRTRVRKCWLSFWFAECKTKKKAKEKADKWVLHAIPPLSRKNPKAQKSTAPRRFISRQLSLPIEQPQIALH